VTHWPEVQFERLYGTEWIAMAPSTEALATAAKTLTAADWQPFLEFVPGAVREFMAPFAFSRLEALQVAARCPALIADLAETLTSQGVPTKVRDIQKKFDDQRYAPQERVPLLELAAQPEAGDEGDEGDEGAAPVEGEGIARGRTEGDWPPAGAVPRGWRARSGRAAARFVHENALTWQGVADSLARHWEGNASATLRHY
jgi:hypothetical protein